MSDNYYKALGEVVKLTRENTALREELASAKRIIKDSLGGTSSDLRIRLTAAEQRNEALETAIRQSLDDSSEDAQTGEITIMRLDYETLAALIGEPTESGASE